ncbi:MAG TPA: HAD family hydrolase [Microthrixaceae bacterium]|nr:HAD family hydrolase [Microthrixaceae bacterium]
MSRHSPIRAITFDFWNTLVAENAESADHRSEQWLSLLASEGHLVDHEVMERAMTDLWSWFTEHWEGNEQVTPEMAIARVLALMEVEVSSGLYDTMVESLHDGRDPNEMQTALGVGDALETLRSAGVAVGIICDVGLSPSSTLRRYLDHHGLLGFFDGWSFSDEVGCYKPDPRIFTHASKLLGVDEPSALAHIGDLRRTDIAGARGAGWTSLRYVGFFDDQSELPEADAVVADHRDLPRVLGLAG